MPPKKDKKKKKGDKESKKGESKGEDGDKAWYDFSILNFLYKLQPQMVIYRRMMV